MQEITKKAAPEEQPMCYWDLSLNQKLKNTGVEMESPSLS